MNQIICGDSLDVLKTLDDESVDLLCTDPPYGYSFMGKKWDKALPDIGIFKETLRVLKPGAFAFVMSAPRSDVCSRMCLLLEEAGFNIAFTPIYWTYASGFPKAMNIGKMVDKRAGAEREKLGEGKYSARRPERPIHSLTRGKEFGHKLGDPITLPATDAAKALNGSYGGFQPKPAVEVIIVAMKPLSEKTYVDQALANGKGITWLDDCRVPVGEETVPRLNKAYERKNGENFGGTEDARLGTITGHESKGRFPANLLVSDDVLNDGTFKRTSGQQTTGRSMEGALFGTRVDGVHYGDEGGYSRFFSLDAWAQTLPFLAVPKASKSEKGKDNKHPTVKPLKLMSYLITLGSRPGDVVLDPFLGSGTTCIAAKELGRQFIGIEREQEYVEIAEARLSAVQPNLLTNQQTVENK